MTPEWIPLILIAGFLGFRGALHLSYPLCLFVHELGHALPARLLGKQAVTIEIGADSPLAHFRMAGITVTLHLKGTDYGITRYEGAIDSRFEACLIILTAPVLSLLLTLALAWTLWGILVPHSLAASFVGSAVLLANLHLTLSTWLPIGNARSDWVDFVKTLRKLQDTGVPSD